MLPPRPLAALHLAANALEGAGGGGSAGDVIAKVASNGARLAVRTLHSAAPQKGTIRHQAAGAVVEGQDGLSEDLTVEDHGAGYDGEAEDGAARRGSEQDTGQNGDSQPGSRAAAHVAAQRRVLQARNAAQAVQGGSEQLGGGRRLAQASGGMEAGHPRQPRGRIRHILVETFALAVRRRVAVACASGDVM